MNNDAPTAERPEFGFNLYGYLTANIGLGVAGRNTARMLISNGVPVRLDDVSAGRGMRGAERSLVSEIERTRALPPLAVNLFHLNPDQMLYLLNPLSSRVGVRDQMQVCVPFWELPRLPHAWLGPLAAMDLVLAPTRYIEQAVRTALPDARVVHFPQAVHVPGGILPDRKRFDLPDDAVVFVTSFDLRSDVERKNPWAVVRAFRRAFPDRPDVRLVIKVNNAEYSSAFPAIVRRLEEEARDARIRVLDERMSYTDVLTLYASADVLVSLHRAEGLGLSLLEAMALGKPVIATAFSGTMDFTDARNSLLVDYRMVPVDASTQYAYSRAFAGEQMWAEADVAQAAGHMSLLAEDPSLRHAMGARARQSAESVREAYDSGIVIDRIRDEYAAWVDDEERRHLTRERMTALQRQFFSLYAKRAVLAAVRRAKTALSTRS